jgi:hypothetical protein
MGAAPELAQVGREHLAAEDLEIAFGRRLEGATAEPLKLFEEIDGKP